LICEQHGIRLTTTPAGLHEKRAERYIRTFKERKAAIQASLPYIIPAELEAELSVHTAFTINNTPNKVSGNKTPWEIMTGRKPKLPKYYFGQTGLFYTKRSDQPDMRAEWGIFIGLREDGVNNLRAHIPTRRTIYSRRKFVPMVGYPPEWGFLPRT
jgi:hypothetical protein